MSINTKQSGVLLFIIMKDSSVFMLIITKISEETLEVFNRSNVLNGILRVRLLQLTRDYVKNY
jgi:hypothetical protein